jgi:hypothetical protein
VENDPEFVGQSPDMDDPNDRKYRHQVDGRMQFATVEQLSRLQRDVVTIRAVQDVQGTQLTSMVESVAEVKGWLQGSTSKEGTPIPGALQNVHLFMVWKNIIMTLVSLGVTSLVGSFLLDLYKFAIHGWK